VGLTHSTFVTPEHLRVTTTLSSAVLSDTPTTVPVAPPNWKDQVLDKLRVVIDPDLNDNIVSLGFIKELEWFEELGVITFNVELTTPACPIKEEFQTQCHDLVLELEWVKEAEVTMTSQPLPVSDVADEETVGMKKVASVIAVSSCKGGVGKSTTAVNLAFALQSLGARVGIFDADVYGPSLPTMITPQDDTVRFVGRQIAPLERNGVKLMSFGYVNEGAAVMRGPMITQLLDQFLSVTNWGELDYMILDMPPGTGDIQLTLTQRLNMTAAVIVTTPQELSFADVVRGIDMFDSVNVPCIAVVENMAYYEVDTVAPAVVAQPDLEVVKAQFRDELTMFADNNGGQSDNEQIEKLTAALLDIVQRTEQPPPPAPTKEKIQIFGKGHLQRLAGQYGIENTFSMPLVNDIAKNGDSGNPYILEHPDTPQSETYRELARSVIKEVSKAKHTQNANRPNVSYDQDAHIIRYDDESIKPATLRRGCKCAVCVEEMSGKQILDPGDVDEMIRPVMWGPTGNYALSIEWSDGHSSLYPYKKIRTLIEEQKVKDLKEANDEGDGYDMVPL